MNPVFFHVSQRYPPCVNGAQASDAAVWMVLAAMLVVLGTGLWLAIR